MEKMNFYSLNERQGQLDVDEDLFSLNSGYYNFVQKMNTWPWKIFYKGLLPKKIKKRIDKTADLSQQKYVEKCWDEVIGSYFKFKSEEGRGLSGNIVHKKEFNGRKVIWQYWGTGWAEEKLPDIVRLCKKSVEKYKGDFAVILLDDSNLSEYIELPEFFMEKKEKIPPAFFADVLRLSLLYLYGGVWLDATVLLTGHLPEKYFNMDYFMFQRYPYTENKKYWMKLNDDYFSWDEDHRVNVLNSVIFSKRNNEVIETLTDLLLVFWEKKEKVPHYFFFQILYDKLMDKYMAGSRCEIIDDTLPHILFSKWNHKFDRSEYEKIKEKISIHKLTHKLVSEKNCIKDSYYDYFIKKYAGVENE